MSGPDGQETDRAAAATSAARDGAPGRDGPLRADVERVTDSLAAVMRAHGAPVADLVVRMENTALRARQAATPEDCEAARAELADEVARLDPASALEVVRAFSLHFQLVNQAEDVHRTRELRRREIEGGTTAVAESLPAVVAELARRGATREQVLELVEDVHLRFVFTSHPTEARRRTTERLLARVREVLEDEDRRILTPTERIVRDRRLRAAIEALWEHAPERRTRPSVLDEVKAGLWYLRHVLLDVVPRVHRRLHRAFETHYGAVDVLALPVTADFGSWMGGDRDGNPFVDDETTRETLELHRWIVLERYAEDVERLVDPLSASVERLPGRDAGIEAALARATEAVPDAVGEIVRRNPDEPLRRLLSFIRVRLARTRERIPGGYDAPAGLLGDLIAIRDLLRRMHAVALADDALLDLILRVRVFGFHLAALDLREDARVHRRVVAELLGDPAFPGREDADRRARLAKLSLPEDPSRLSAEARRLLAQFASAAAFQARFGRDAIGTYAISMATSAADVLAVVRLAALYGFDAGLDVVPLFETPDALESAAAILDTLLADPGYRAHVKQRGDVQEVLLGYSDSAKELGLLASRTAIRDAQCAAAGACGRHGVTILPFHGRGGSASRGGGPTYRAIRAMPREAFSGRMKLTEQGETRAFNFANPDLAARYLERSVGAALLARHEARFAPPAVDPRDAETLAELARAAREAWRELVEDPDLVRFFVEATPFESIAALQIASRPSSRPRAGGKGLSLQDLRAIPWVFAWSESRAVLTGWYGVGSALSSFAARPGGPEELRRLYRESAFFRDVLDNVQMMLAKADMPIAQRYAGLCRDPAVRARIFGRIREEFDRTRETLLRASGLAGLLDEDPVLQRSIRLRNPYVDPLSYLQVEALRRARGDGRDAPEWEQVARSAVQGIAAGLRNTG